jgi:hypothetical protein
MNFTRSLAFFIILSCGGCVLPIPHQRIHQYGVKGSVVDSKSGKPIENAKICSLGIPESCISKINGNFTLKPIKGWHGAYFLGPISFSLFPDWDMTAPTISILISSTDYISKKITVKEHFASKGYLDSGTILLTPRR